MQQTNYLDPDSFNKFIEAIPKIHQLNAINVISKTPFINPLSKEMVQLFFKILYYCALRVSECINLEKGDFDLEHRILRVRRAKTGNNQKTSIPKPLLEALNESLDVCPDKLFSISRQTVWVYAKEAGKLAGLNIFEFQDKREIEGLWTHAFRKAYAKMMYEAEAKGALIDVKLRHTHKNPNMADSTFTYIKPDINALIDWESKHFEA